MQNGPRRVVVTGMGAACSLGLEVTEIWKAVLDGRSGATQIRQFDSEAFPVRIGSEVDLGAIRLEDISGLEPFLSRSASFGIWALDKAWSDAGLDNACIDRERAGVCVGASTFPVIDDNLPDPHTFVQGDHYNADIYLDYCRTQPHVLAQRDIPSISSLFSLRHDLCGPSYTVQSACSSATQAIGESFEMIRRGDVDIMVTGGTDSMMSVICVTGFTLLGALTQQNDRPEKASRPFDLKRDGFLIGEGAGIIVLEELNSALRRQAPIHAELIGYGSTSDGYRFTDIHPEGLGPARAMLAALKSAGIRPEDVDYINAHGTSTPQNDRVETLAIKKAFGEYAYSVPISSTKSQLGHLVCAAGGIEMIFSVLTLKSQVIPATINLDYRDPNCDLDYVPNEAREARVRIAISNSFAFGGQNATLVVKRWEQKAGLN